ncbi:hypothetical protein FKM82_006048 [Ascaphus truei]
MKTRPLNKSFLQSLTVLETMSEFHTFYKRMRESVRTFPK